jgi:hypothetical protein
VLGLALQAKQEMLSHFWNCRSDQLPPKMLQLALLCTCCSYMKLAEDCV